MFAQNAICSRVSLLTEVPPLGNCIATALPMYKSQEVRKEGVEGQPLPQSNLYKSIGSSENSFGPLLSSSSDSHLAIDTAPLVSPSILELGWHFTTTCAYQYSAQLHQRHTIAYSHSTMPPPSTTAKPLTIDYRMSRSFNHNKSSSEGSLMTTRPHSFEHTHRSKKTFTVCKLTSCSSRIRIARKHNRCSIQRRPKKFNRADNMKQHLRTHRKGSFPQPSPPGELSFMNIPSKLTLSAGTTDSCNGSSQSECETQDVSETCRFFNDSSPGPISDQDINYVPPRSTPHGLDALVKAIDIQSCMPETEVFQNN